LRTLTRLALAVGCVLALGDARPPARAAAQDVAGAGIETLGVRGNVSVLFGAGGNVVVQAGDEGVLVVDTQLASTSPTLLAAIRGLSSLPIRYVINTHMHADHIGGNDDIARAGSTATGGNVVGNIGADATRRAAIVAHENVLTRISAPTGAQAVTPFALWPTDVFFTAQKDLLFNGEAVQLLHQPNAHTDGDILVFFRRSDVIATGDVFGTTAYPVVDTANGGHINGIVDALNRIIDVAVPSNVQEGGTMIVPGHGRITDEWEVVEYRDMVTIVRDRIAAMIGRGMTLAEVQAARPTLEYDPRFGADTGAWTTTMFVETVYRNLRQR
jgi:glyoxylase-like metal-dependent hydrolase (beta-lactamase superfamily II)